MLGFEGSALSFDTHAKFKKALPGLKLKPASSIMKKLRIRKDAFEIARIRESAAILDRGFEAARKLIGPGSVERDAALKIEIEMRKAGADGLAFDTIIASGERGALPHGKASGKKVKKGELVVVDMGALLNGYHSDETRTFCVGKATKLQREIYGVVKDAQARAIEAIRPGVDAAEVDRAARAYIDKAGYGKYFGHGTGHGVGLEIHESPNVSPLSSEILEEGMVITVEPGIYIPGWGGVRIEDMAVVTKDGFEILTKTPKDFFCI